MDGSLRLDGWLGRRVLVVIDRPLGSAHPREPDLIYRVNYGYVPGTLAPDGEPLDVYVLGGKVPLGSCEAEVIAIIRRNNDAEDKLVASIAGIWDARTVADAVAFRSSITTRGWRCRPPASSLMFRLRRWVRGWESRRLNASRMTNNIGRPNQRED